VGSRGRRKQIVLESEHFQKWQINERVWADEINGIIAQIQKRQIRRPLQLKTTFYILKMDGM